MPGNKIGREILMHSDALLIRTRTKCNESLLKGTNVRFVGTATIGFDHIDTNYCDANNIHWTNAPGCNSKSVEQYIASTLMVLAERKGWTLKEKCIGVVGVGNVGSKVARICEILGMKVLLNDPPRERAKGADKFVSLETIQHEADIITLHVPLETKGEDATFHLGNEQFLHALTRKPVMINSCRGEVIETKAVKTALQLGHISAFVCDCWENEPDIDFELLALTEIVTPHIAGYSKDGKAIGTQMSVQAISRYFKLGLDDWKPSGIELPENHIIEIDGSELSEQKIISKAILHTYDIRNDDRDFRNHTEQFELLRGDYPTRREFPAFTIVAKNINEETMEKLKQIGFNI